MIMAGFHEQVFPPCDQATHTQAMINAIKSGRVDMISHPGNPAFPIDIQAVVKAAADYRVALEINNSSFIHSRPGSEGNCRAIVEAARDLGAYLTFGSDSHVAFTLGDFGHCHRLVTEAGFPQERLLVRSPVPCSISSRAAAAPISPSLPTCKSGANTMSQLIKSSCLN